MSGLDYREIVGALECAGRRLQAFTRTPTFSAGSLQVPAQVPDKFPTGARQAPDRFFAGSSQ
eukprot:2275290-Lingulodinium_polyedra.AAC.1